LLASGKWDVARSHREALVSPTDDVFSGMIYADITGYEATGAEADKPPKAFR
jgi:hypothetical protein